MTNAPRKVNGWTPEGIVLFAIALDRHRLGSTEPRLSNWGWWPAERNKVASTRLCGNMELRIDDSEPVECFFQRNSNNKIGCTRGALVGKSHARGRNGIFALNPPKSRRARRGRPHLVRHAEPERSLAHARCAGSRWRSCRRNRRATLAQSFPAPALQGGSEEAGRNRA
jgi:hypothetical protein